MRRLLLPLTLALTPCAVGAKTKRRIWRHRVGTITTNKQGNANLHFTDERIEGTTKFFVEVFYTSAFEFFASPAVELD